MKSYDLGSTDPRQYETLTEAEKVAWIYPEPHSYHSYHIERMGADTFRWRNSREGKFYVGTANQLLSALYDLRLRKLDPHFEKAMQSTQVLKLLSDQEIDDLLSDL